MASALSQAKSMAKYNNQLMLSNAKQAQSFNAKEAQKTRDWQEDMANTAHQREMADLKKAGLNPVLSVFDGGAATPSGATASGQAADVDTSLTNGILQMAMNQMNNATTMQRVAMETQNALMIATMNNQRAWQEHVTPGGNTTFGQVLYGMGMAGLMPESSLPTSSKEAKKFVNEWHKSSGTGNVYTGYSEDYDDVMARLGLSSNRTVGKVSKAVRNHVKAVNRTYRKSGHYRDKYGSAGSLFRALFT